MANEDVVDLAQSLLGSTLVGTDGTEGIIVETEAYHQREAACHGFGGVPTARTQALFGPPGTWYIYFTYGMHWCLNVVAEDKGVAAAVLLRAIRPTSGLEVMQARRPAAKREQDLCAGPARLVCAFGIGPEVQGMPVFVDAAGDLPWIRRGTAPPRAEVLIGPRIGISKAVELPWRFGLRGEERWFSKPFPTRTERADHPLG